MAAELDTMALYGYETLSGSPPATKKPIRLFSMEYCPFAERTRMALVKTGVEHDIVNVHLKNKPLFLHEHTPNGQVPTLLHEGHSIYESEVIVEYLENRFRDTASLYPADPAQRALARLLITQHGTKVLPAYYKVFTPWRSDDQAGIDAGLQVWYSAVETWVEQKLGDGPFFGGEKENIVDILVWPWVYKPDILTRHAIINYLPKERFPKTLRYIQAMREVAYVKVNIASDENFIRFCRGVKEGKPCFNIGSKHPFYEGPEAQ